MVDELVHTFSPVYDAPNERTEFNMTIQPMLTSEMCTIMEKDTNGTQSKVTAKISQDESEKSKSFHEYSFANEQRRSKSAIKANQGR